MGSFKPSSQINYTSLSDLNTYSNQNMTYTTYAGFSASITRFKFDGTLDVSNYIVLTVYKNNVATGLTLTLNSTGSTSLSSVSVRFTTSDILDIRLQTVGNPGTGSFIADVSIY